MNTEQQKLQLANVRPDQYDNGLQPSAAEEVKETKGIIFLEGRISERVRDKSQEILEASHSLQYFSD